MEKKPLFYLNNSHYFCFGSEVKFIMSLLEIQPEVNIKKIKKFLVCGFRSLFKERTSFFSGIKELEPANNLIINKNKNIKITKYWNLKYSPLKIHENEIYEESKRLLNKSISIRMRSDVPIAFCMSGGIDSTAIASIANKKLGTKIHTFSVIDKDNRYDESKNILDVINYIECNSTFIRTSPIRFLENLEKIISYFQSPIPTISYYIHNQLIKSIKKSGFSVVMSGTGADEIYSGYYDHYNFWLEMMSSKPNFKKVLNDWMNGYSLKINNPLIKNISNFLKNKKFRSHLYQNSKDFNKLLIDKIDDRFNEINYSSDNLRNRMLNELNQEIVPAILFSDDLNSMMYSIENRSPFLDKDLVEFMSKVDSKFLIQKGMLKFILRENVKNLLPKNVVFNKEKIGFNASILSFVNLKNNDFVGWLTSSSPIFDLVDKGKFTKFLREDFSKNFFQNSYLILYLLKYF